MVIDRIQIPCGAPGLTRRRQKQKDQRQELLNGADAGCLVRLVQRLWHLDFHALLKGLQLCQAAG